ncbi:MAG: class I SAM-dependent methyltransferase [Anaerolineae bacterium]|nr:class I SAM-dependent methyltransferase [Anaerolineae bacterium]
MHRLWGALVQFGFRLLYNELAFTYDGVSEVVSLGAWHCWQRAALKHLAVPPGARVLELAHGTGNLQIDLLGLGYQTFGYDLSASMGRITRRKLRQQNLPVRLIQGRAQELPYPSSVFAAVISTFPTPFILEAETLQEVHRVLQADGQFIIVPNGVLTTGGAPEAGLEWLYRITGQRQEPRFEVASYFAPYGFSVEIVQEPCPRSVATVVSARKK